jgi:hypothetical protein
VFVNGEYVRISILPVKVDGLVVVLAWRSCGEARKSSVRVAGKTAKIQIVY